MIDLLKLCEGALILRLTALQMTSDGHIGHIYTVTVCSIMDTREVSMATRGPLTHSFLCPISISEVKNKFEA